MKHFLFLGALITGSIALFSGCSMEMQEGEEEGPLAESTAEIIQPGTATLTVTSEWATGFCANVNVKNTGANQSNSWRIILSLYSSKYTRGWEGTFSPEKNILIITPSANNGSIAPGGTASPLPGFCADRPAGTPLPTASLVEIHHCGMAYRDADNDGYGTGSLVYTCERGYSTKNGDCCDSDRFAFPGQTLYTDIPNRCGSWDYSCNGTVEKKSNGPTGCYEAPMTCRLSADRSTCIASGSPAGCNGGFTSYNTGECGEEWSISTKGCARACSGSSCWCTAWFNGGPGSGSQQCH
jgi:endo-1,4-beta-xylanase